MTISRSARMLAAITLAASLSACTTYSPGLCEGDAEFTATPRKAGAFGPLSGENHELRFPAISVLSPERYTFRVSGLPHEMLHATLALDEPSEAKLDIIDKAGVRVRMSVTNVGTGESTVKEGRLLGDWGVTAQSWTGTPTDFDGFWFRPERHDVYHLTVQIMVTNPPQGQFVTVTPRFNNSDTRLP